MAKVAFSEGVKAVLKVARNTKKLDEGIRKRNGGRVSFPEEIRPFPSSGSCANLPIVDDAWSHVKYFSHVVILRLLFQSKAMLKATINKLIIPSVNK